MPLPLVLQAPQRDDLHPVRSRVGHLTTSQHNHQVRLTDRHLLLLLVVFTNQPFQLYQMRGLSPINSNDGLAAAVAKYSSRI